MTLVSSQQLLRNAQEAGYALGAFNVYNLETLQGVVEVSQELSVPVILQASESTLRFTGIDTLSALVKSIARGCPTPLVWHLDHGHSLEIVKECVQAGFTSVMIDASDKPLGENIKITKGIVKLARTAGVQIEAELGKVGRRGKSVATKFLTDPEDARVFVGETGVNSLAVAIGTVHGLYRGEPNMDFQRLSAIRESVDVPLVLHGGTGLPNNILQRAIKQGICKVNIATEQKMAFLDGMRRGFAETKTDIRYVLGQGKCALKKVVKMKIRVLGTPALT